MLLYNVLCADSFKRVIEIGSHFGVSTTAFVQAQRRYRGYELHVCDIEIRATVREMCADSIRSGRTALHEKTSWAFLSKAPSCDFVLLDGSHIAEHVQDEFELLSAKGLRTIVLHDTQTQFLPESAETPWFDGPPRIADRLRHSVDWLSLEDRLRRPGEMTQRGFFLATRDVRIYRLAQRAFQFWGSIPTEDIERRCGIPRTAEQPPERDK